jgi:hypothetical protein
MKTLIKIIQLFTLSIIVFGSVQFTPSVVSAASDRTQPSKTPAISIYLNSSQVSSSVGAPVLLNGTVMLPLDGLYIGGATVNYDERTKMITITNIFTKGSIKVGSRYAAVNGKKVVYSAGPQQINKHLYLPLRFVNDAIGGSLKWDAVYRAAIISYPEYVGEGIVSNDAYFLNGVSGTLYKRDTAGFIHSLGETAAKLVPGYFGNTKITAVKIAEDADLVTIESSHGEPLINLDVINLFVKKGVILRQSKAHYWRFYPEDLKVYNGNAVMNDGHIVRLIAPDDSVKESWNISELAGEPKDSYSIEAIGDNYLIVRSSQEGLLTLIDLKANEAILLYKEFDIKPSDLPGMYDGIKFTGNTEDKSELQFEFTNRNNIKNIYTYKLAAK